MTDDAWERALAAYLQGGDEPADAGFSQRVMAKLPPQQRPASANGPAHAAGVVAIGVACGALALVPLTEAAALEQWTSVVVLLALLLWWSLPQSRGGVWR